MINVNCHLKSFYFINRIERKIGEGSYGEVYLKNDGIQRTALKVHVGLYCYIAAVFYNEDIISVITKIIVDLILKRNANIYKRSGTRRVRMLVTP